MNATTEQNIAILAAIFVLFTAMLDPTISVALALLFLLGLGIYQFRRQH